jgi:hypothetical protein
MTPTCSSIKHAGSNEMASARLVWLDCRRWKESHANDARNNMLAIEASSRSNSRTAPKAFFHCTKGYKNVDPERLCDAIKIRNICSLALVAVFNNTSIVRDIFDLYGVVVVAEIVHIEERKLFLNLSSPSS